MSLRSLACLLGSAIFLTGCIIIVDNDDDDDDKREEDRIEEPEDQCGASDYQSLVGSPIAAVTLPADLNERVIRPGDAITKDYRLDRLNIDLDEDGNIVRLWCG